MSLKYYYLITHLIIASETILAISSTYSITCGTWKVIEIPYDRQDLLIGHPIVFRKVVFSIIQNALCELYIRDLNLGLFYA